MTPVSPAIVAQSAVRPLARGLLVLLCLGYTLPGFWWREPWKHHDMAALGHMWALVHDGVSWLRPTVLGWSEPQLALLPSWLGAWAMMLAPAQWAAEAARLPFVVMLLGTLACTWYAVYELARTPQAQPVAFAFGGEARPTDYARTLADGGLLALLACLGLAQLAHETTPALAQLGGTALLLLGLASLPRRPRRAAVATTVGMLTLTLSGAPALAQCLLWGGGLVLYGAVPAPEQIRPGMLRWGLLALLALLCAVLAGALDLWRWRLVPHRWLDVHDAGRLLVWFTWPAWPLALWALWSWRRQVRTFWRCLHIGLPLWFGVVTLGNTWLTGLSDRALLTALPAIATLAAFALPTLRRSVSALIDWFTLLFFSAAALTIWVVWLAMQTGWPAAPARNVVRAAPEFVPSFSLPFFVLAMAATLAWLALVRWRTARHPSALWKSLVLPAAGASLCWLLLMTLWLPLLDHARSYKPLMDKLAQTLPSPECVQVLDLNPAQITALRHHNGWTLQALGSASAACPWLLSTDRLAPEVRARLQGQGWQVMQRWRRPTDNDETWVLHQWRPS